MLLVADLTLLGADDLRLALLQALERGEHVQLDGRRVQRVDLACLQVLVAFVRATAERGQPASWVGYSKELEQAARVGGVAELLGL